LCDNGGRVWVPRELDKATSPLYRIEPPDILLIDVVQQIAQSSYTLQMGDTVALTVLGTFPEEPIVGEYPVEAGGIIRLGYAYGSVEVAGRTVDEAIQLVSDHLRQQLREPQVSMSLRTVANMQRISGEHLVGPDGTVTLGQYGSVPVVGLTLDEARMAISDHLSSSFVDPQVSVTVYAFNSKSYYIVTQGAATGDSLVRLPYTGNETVMDALSQINGLSYVSSSRMWIARPQHNGQQNQILPIDWEAMTQRAEVETNYQLLPGDRLYIAQDRLVAFDGAIAKLTSPFERVFGFTLLGTGTVSRLSGKVLRNGNVPGFNTSF
jgi:protein involved in polysaccharide export with SLBB domain